MSERFTITVPDDLLEAAHERYEAHDGLGNDPPRYIADGAATSGANRETETGFWRLDPGGHTSRTGFRFTKG